MRTSSSLSVSSGTAMGLTAATAVAIAVILLASNFTIINAQQQQQLSSPSGEIENGTTTPTATTFQSTVDSFSVQVPQGWIVHDMNNSGSALSEETTQGYGVLAQLCPEEEQQQAQAAALTNNSGSSDTPICERSENDVIHIIRYPDLDTRLFANNITTSTNNNMTTTDNIVSYHLQKLQEVGYRSMQIVNSADMTVNLTNPQTNETIETIPAELVEMTYSTGSAPNEITRGYFIATATNNTAPSLGVTKGYAVFYEGNSTTTNAAATITPASSSLPLPTPVEQAFDSFELIVAPEVAQALAEEEAQAEETVESEDDDGGDGGDDDGGDGGDDDGDDNGGDGDGGEDISCHPSYPDTCIPPPPPNLNCDDVDETNFEVEGSDPHGFDGDNDGIGCEDGDGDGDDNGGDGDEGEGNEGESNEGEGNEGEDEFDDCIVTPGRDPGDVGC
jgi:hypothetical protein